METSETEERDTIPAPPPFLLDSEELDTLLNLRPPPVPQFELD
jgi:hypothetical protein